MQTRVIIIVKGLVQGVGYRYFCYRKAQEYDITGYAKNLIDSSVEVLAEGNKNLVNDFIKELKTGPSNSFVKSVYVEELESGSPENNNTEKMYENFKML